MCHRASQRGSEQERPPLMLEEWKPAEHRAWSKAYLRPQAQLEAAGTLRAEGAGDSIKEWAKASEHRLQGNTKLQAMHVTKATTQ